MVLRLCCPHGMRWSHAGVFRSRAHLVDSQGPKDPEGKYRRRLDQLKDSVDPLPRIHPTSATRYGLLRDIGHLPLSCG